MAIEIRGVNHGRPWVLDDLQFGEADERSLQITTQGRKELRSVSVTMDNGHIIDLTGQVLEQLGTAVFDVHYPDDVTVGSCQSWVAKPIWRMSGQ